MLDEMQPDVSKVRAGLRIVSCYAKAEVEFVWGRVETTWWCFSCRGGGEGDAHTYRSEVPFCDPPSGHHFSARLACAHHVDVPPGGS